MAASSAAKLRTRGKFKLSLSSTVVALTILTFPLALAVPIAKEQHQCAQSCPEDGGLWQYAPGSTYTFDYEVNTVTAMKGASSQTSEIHLQATAKVHVLDRCNFQLSINDVEFGNGHREFMDSSYGQDLTRFPLNFAFLSGQIPEVCPHEDESIWALNVKRGLLSAFQNTLTTTSSSTSSSSGRGQNYHEVDVVGICPTSYKQEFQSENEARYIKSKDMKECSRNQKLHQHALNVPDINIQHLPLLESQHECNVAIRDGILHSSKCKEKHIFKPFSHGNAQGAITEQTQSLEFRGGQAGTSSTPLAFAERVSLLLTHEHKNDQKDSYEEALVVLQQFFDHQEINRRPHLFTELTHALRKLNFSQLYSFFVNIQGESRRFALDAIPLLRTDAGVQLMVDRILSGELDHEKMERWFYSLTFYKNPTATMIGTLIPFLEGQPGRSAILGISALISTFCQSEKDCQADPEVQRAILKFEKILGANCYAMGQEEEDRVILALKALRNVGLFINAEPITMRCFQEKTNPMEIRLAAMDLARDMACRSSSAREALLQVLSLTDNDSELRIGAYLALFKCPDKALVQQLKTLLLQEPVNQVGSFIWTHLTNLQETRSLSASKQFVKKLIGTEFLKNKWNTDVRKFSRYFETSQYNEDGNFGGTAEANVIFSQESYLPRSAMINMSLSLFGEHLNLFELGGRIEGFESMIEDLFGPDGKFREDTFHKILKSLRQKRDVESNEIASFQQSYNNYREEQPKGNYYFRMFGKDIWYESFLGLQDLWRKVSYYPGHFFGSKEQAVDLARSNIFLDGGITIPTMAGLPLKLIVNGTYSASLKSSVQMETKDLFLTGHAKVQAHIYPTASVEVIGLMSVDGGVAKTGLKSVSTLYSNTFLDGSIHFRGQDGVSAVLNMPKDTVEVLEASVDFFTFGDTTFEPLVSENTLEKSFQCTPNIYSNFFAVEACHHYQYHASQDNEYYFPASFFAGPSKFGFSFRKTDQFQRYALVYGWSQVADKDQQNNLIHKAKFSFDTPGSLQDHKTSMELVYDDLLTLVGFDFTVPYRSIRGSGKYQWSANQKLLKGAILANGVNLASMQVGLKSAQAEGRYGVRAQVNYGDLEIVDWSGTLNIMRNKASLDGMMMGNFHTPVKVLADWSFAENSASLRTTFNSKRLDFNLNGHATFNEDSLVLGGDASYDWMQSGSRAIQLDARYKTSSSGALKKHNIFISSKIPGHPQLQFETIWDIQTSTGYLENKAKLMFAEDTYTLQQIVSSQQKSDLSELIFKAWLEVPKSNMKYGIDFVQMASPQKGTNQLRLSYGQSFRFDTHFNYERQDDPGVYYFDAGIEYPSQRLQLLFDLREESRGDFNGRTQLQWGETIREQIEAEFRLKPGSKGMHDYAIVVSLRPLDWEPISITGILLSHSGRSLAEFKWIHGEEDYHLRLEHAPIQQGLESGIVGILKANQMDYNGTLIYRFDEVMSAFKVDVHAEKHYQVRFQVDTLVEDVELSVYWDKNVDDSKRFLLKSQMLPKQVLAEFDILIHSGSLDVSLLPRGYAFKGKFDDQYLTTEAEWRLDDEVYGVRGIIESSFEPIKEGKVIAKHSLQRKMKPSRKTVMDTKIAVQLNDAVKHSVSWKSEYNGISLLKAEIKTTSTYEPFNGHQAWINHYFQGGKFNSKANLNQNQHDFFDLTVVLEPMTKGLLKLSTDWKPLTSLDIHLNHYGKTIGADFDLNRKHQGRFEVELDLKERWNHFIKVRGSSSSWSDFEGQWKLNRDDDGTECRFLALLGQQGIEWQSDFAKKDQDCSVHVQITRHCPTRPHILLIRMDRISQQLKILATRSTSSQVVNDLTFTVERKKMGLDSKLRLVHYDQTLDAHFNTNEDGGSADLMHYDDGEKTLDVRVVVQQQKELVPSDDGTATTDQQYVFDALVWRSEVTLGKVFLLGTIRNGQPLKFETKIESGSDFFESNMEIIATEGSETDLTVITKSKSSYPFLQEAILEFSREIQNIDDSFRSKDRLSMTHNNNEYLATCNKQMGPEGLEIDLSLTKDRKFLGQLEVEMNQWTSGTLRLMDAEKEYHKVHWNSNDSTGHTITIESPLLVDPILLSCQFSLINPHIEMKAVYQVDVMHVLFDSDYNTGTSTFYGLVHPNWIQEDSRFVLSMKFPFLSQLTRNEVSFKGQLNTPIDGWQEAAAEIQFDLSNANGMNRVEFDIQKNMEKHKGVMYTEYHPSENIKLWGDLSLAGYDVKGDISANMNRRSIDVHYHHWSGDEISAQIKFPVITSGNMRSDATIQMNGQDYAKIQTYIDISSGMKTVFGQVEVFPKQIWLRVNGDLSKSNGLLTLDRSWSQPTSTKSQISYLRMKNKGTIKVSLDVDQHQNIDLNWKNLDNGIEIDLKTPLESIKTLQVRLLKTFDNPQHKSFEMTADLNENSDLSARLNWKEKSNVSVVVKLDSPYTSPVDIALDYNLAASHRQASLKVQTPWEAYEGLVFVSEDFHSAHILADYTSEGEKVFLNHFKYNTQEVFDQELTVRFGGSEGSVKLDDEGLLLNVRHPWIGQWEAKATSANGAHHARLSQDDGHKFELNLTGKFDQTKEIGEINGRLFCKKWLKEDASEISLSYDFHDIQKKFNLQGLVIASKTIEFDVSSTFQFERKRFQGNTIVISNQLDRNLDLNLEVAIKPEPEIKFSYQFEGALRNDINMLINMNNEEGIPFVRITTPFPGYQELVMIGNFKSGNGKKLFKIIVKKEDQVVMEMKNKIQLDSGRVDLTSVLTTPFELWKRFQIGFSTQWQEPYSIKALVALNDDTYTLDGSLSLIQNELYLDLTTPIPGFESIIISGKSGTTSIGKSLGFSFEQNRERRDLGFEYELVENNFKALVQSPFDSLRRVKIVKRSAEDFAFDFETSGDALDFALGVHYEIVGSQGQIALKVELENALGSRFNEFRTNVVFDRMDGNPDNGFLLEVQAEVDEEKKLIFKASKPDSGGTQSDFWEQIQGIVIEAEAKGRHYSLQTLKTGAKLVQINMKSPQPEFTSLELFVHKKDDISYDIRLKREDIEALNLSFEVPKDFSKVTLDLKANKNARKWMSLHLSATPSLVEPHFDFKFESSSRKAALVSATFTTVVQSSGKEKSTTRHFSGKFNDKMLEWDSTSTTLGKDHSKGSSKVVTNWSYLGFQERTTDYEKKEGDGGLPKWTYITTQNGESQVSATVQQLEDGFDISYVGVSPMKDKKELEVQAQIRTDMKSTAKITVLTNLPTFRKLEAQGALTLRLNPTNIGLKLRVRQNDQDILKMGLGFLEPKARAYKMPIQISFEPFNFQQKIELLAEGNPSKNLKASVKAKGTLMDVNSLLEVEISQEGTLITGKANADIKASRFKPFDVAGKFALKNNLVDMTLKNLKKDRTHHVIVGLSSPQHLKLIVDSPWVPFVKSKLNYEIRAKNKVIEGQLELGQKKFASRLEGTWSRQASSLKGKLETPKGTYVMTAARENLFEKASFEIRKETVAKPYITINLSAKGAKSLSNGKSPSNFEFQGDIMASSLHPEIEKPNYLDLKINLVGKHSNGNEQQLTGTASIRNYSIDIDYNHNKRDKTFTLNLTSQDLPIKKFVMDLHDKNEDTKGLTITLGERQFTIYTNLHTIRSLKPDQVGLVGIIGNDVVPTSELHIDFGEKQFKFIFKDRNLFLRWEGSMSMSNEGADFKAKLQAMGYFSYDMDLDGSVRTDEKHKALNVNLRTNGELYASSSVEVDLKPNNSGALIQIKYNFEGHESKDLLIKGDLEDVEQNRSVSIDIIYNGKNINGKLLWNKGGKVEVSLDSPFEAFQHFEYAFSHEHTNVESTLKFMQQGHITKAQVKAQLETGKVYSLHMLLHSNAEYGELNFDADLEAKTLDFQAEWHGQTISLKSKISGKDVEIKVTSPYQNMEDVTLTGQWERTSNGLRLKASSSNDQTSHDFVLELKKLNKDESTLFWSLRQDTNEIKFTLNTKQTSLANMDVNLDLTSHKENLFRLGVKYYVLNKFLHAELNMNCPSIKVYDAQSKFHIGFVSPRNMQILLKSEYSKSVSPSDGSERLFNIVTELQFEEFDNVVLKFEVEVPSLGLEEGDVSLEIVFRVQAKEDFEVAAKVGVNGQLFNYGIKYRRTEEGEIESRIRFTGQNLQFDLSVKGQLDWASDMKTAKLAMREEGLNWGEGEFNLKYDTTTRDSEAKIYVKCESGLCDAPLRMEYNYVHGESLRLSGQMFDQGTLTVAGKKTDDVVSANFESDFLPIKSASFLLEEPINGKGRFELSAKKAENSGLNFRVRRDIDEIQASITDPTHGEINLTYGKGTQNVLFFKSKEHFHQLAYGIDEDQVFLQVNSPLLAKKETKFLLRRDPQHQLHQMDIFSALGSIKGDMYNNLERLGFDVAFSHDSSEDGYGMSVDFAKSMSDGRAKIQVREDIYELEANNHHTGQGEGSMGVSFGINEDRKEFGLAYEVDDDSLVVDVQSPMETLKAFKVINRMKRDTGNVEFQFEAEGNEDLLLAGLGFRFDQNKRTLEALLRTSLLPGRYGKIELNSSWNNVDRDMTNGFEINANVMASGEIIRQFSISKTPSPGLDKTTLLEAVKGFSMKISSAKKTTFAMNTLETPPGLFKLHITTKNYCTNKPMEIDIEASTNLDDQVNFKVDVDENSILILEGKVNKDTDLMASTLIRVASIDQSKFGEFDFTIVPKFKLPSITLKITSSHPKLEILEANFQTTISEQGQTMNQIRTFDFKFNDKFITWRSESSSLKDSPDSSGTSTTKTNMVDLLGFNEQTNAYEISSGLDDEANMWSYQTHRDGELRMRVVIERVPNGFDISYKGRSPLDGKNLEMQVKLRTNKRSTFNANIKTNIATFKEMEVKGSLRSEGKKHELKGLATLNGEEVGKVGLGFRSNERSAGASILVAAKPFGFNQQLSISVTNLQNKPKKLSLKTEARIRGTILDLTSDLSLVLPKNNQELPFMDFSAFGALKGFQSGPKTFDVTSKLELGNKKMDLDLVYTIQKQRGKHEVKASLTNSELDLKVLMEHNAYTSSIYYKTSLVKSLQELWSLIQTRSFEDEFVFKYQTPERNIVYKENNEISWAKGKFIRDWEYNQNGFLHKEALEVVYPKAWGCSGRFRKSIEMGAGLLLDVNVVLEESDEGECESDWDILWTDSKWTVSQKIDLKDWSSFEFHVEDEAFGQKSPLGISWKKSSSPLRVDAGIEFHPLQSWKKHITLEPVSVKYTLTDMESNEPKRVQQLAIDINNVKKLSYSHEHNGNIKEWKLQSNMIPLSHVVIKSSGLDERTGMRNYEIKVPEKSWFIETNIGRIPTTSSITELDDLVLKAHGHEDFPVIDFSLQRKEGKLMLKYSRKNRLFSSAITLDENSRTTAASIKLDTPEQKMETHISIDLGEQKEVEIKVNLDDQTWMEATIVFDGDSPAKSSTLSGSFSFPQQDQMLNFKADAESKADIIRGGMTVSFNGKEANLRLLKTQEGILSLDLTTDLPTLKRLKVVAEYQSRGTAILDLLMEGSRTLKANFESNLGIDQVYGLSMKAELDDKKGAMTSVLDLSDGGMKFVFDSQWLDETLTLKAESEGSKVEINVSSTLQEISDVNLEGTWSINENGGSIKASGDHEGNPVTFELNYGKMQTEYSLEWSLMSLVTKEITFAWTTNFENVQNFESNLHLDVDDETLSHLAMKIATIDGILISSTLSIPKLNIFKAEGQLIMHQNGPNNSELKTSFHFQDKESEEPQAVFETQLVAKVLSPWNFDLRYKVVLPALAINPGDVDVAMVLSLDSATDFEIETRVGVKGELYQARVQLDRDENGKGVIGGVTLKGLGVNVESNFEYTVNGDKRTSKINLVTLSSQTGAKRQFTSEIEMDCPSGNLSFSLNMDNVYDEVPPISVVVEAKQWRTLEGFLTKNDLEVLQWNMACSQADKTFQAEISSDIAPIQSIHMKLNWSKPGEMELWVLKNPNHKTGVRVKRDLSQISAIFHDPHMGNFHFELGEHVKSGILVMKTRDAIHKLSYDLTMKDSNYDIRFDLRSPLLQKGSSQFHLIINPKGNHYKVQIDSEFGSIQSNVLMQDRGLTFQFQSVALGKYSWFHSMNMKLKVKNSESEALFDLGIVPNELLFWRTYDCRLSLDKNNLRGNIKLRISNLVDFKAHGSLTYHPEGTVWDGKVQYNGRKLNVHGEVANADWNSWDVSVLIDEPTNPSGKPHKISLLSGFHWSESKKMILFQTLLDQPNDNELLFTLDAMKGTFEVVLPFFHSTHKLAGNFSLDEHLRNCVIQMEVNGYMHSLTFGYTIDERDQVPKAIQLEYLDHSGHIVAFKFEIASSEWKSLHLLLTGQINFLDISQEAVLDFQVNAKEWGVNKELSANGHLQINGEFFNGNIGLSCNDNPHLKVELISSLNNHLRYGLECAWTNTNVHQQLRVQLYYDNDQPLGVWINRRYQSYQDFDLALQTNVPWILLGIPKVNIHIANAKLEGIWRRLALEFGRAGFNFEYTLCRPKEFGFNLHGFWSKSNQILINHHHLMLSESVRISSTVKGLLWATPLTAKVNIMTRRQSQFKWNSLLGRWGGHQFELFQLPSSHIKANILGIGQSGLQWSQAGQGTFLRFNLIHNTGNEQVDFIHLLGQTSVSERNIVTKGVNLEIKLPCDQTSFSSLKFKLSETSNQNEKTGIFSLEKLVLPQGGLEIRMGELNDRSVKVLWQTIGRQKTSRRIIGLTWTSKDAEQPLDGGVTFTIHSDHMSAMRSDVFTVHRLGVQPRTLTFSRIQEKRGIEMRALVTSPIEDETFDVRYLFKGLREFNRLDFELGSHLKIGSSIKKSILISGDVNLSTLDGQYRLQLDQEVYDAQVSHLITPLEGYTFNADLQLSTVSGLKIGGSSLSLEFDPNAPLLSGKFLPLYPRSSGSIETQFRFGLQSASLIVANMTISEFHEPKYNCSCSLEILQDHILKFETIGSQNDVIGIQDIWIQPTQHFLREILLQPIVVSQPSHLVLKNIQKFTIGLLDDFIESLDDTNFKTSMEKIVETKWSLINVDLEFMLSKVRLVMVEISRVIDFRITIERQYLRALLSVSKTLVAQVSNLVIDGLDKGMRSVEENINIGISSIRTIAPISFLGEHVIPHLEMALTQMNEWWISTQLFFTDSSVKKICTFVNEFAQQIRQEAFQFFKELHLFLKQVEFVQSSLELYWDYQSWLEEIHFSEHVENALGDAASAISQCFSVAKTIHYHTKSAVSNLWNGFENELLEISEQLPLPMAQRLARRSFDFLSYSASLVTDITSLREIFKATMTQIDAWTGLIFRVTNVIFYGNDLPQLVQTRDPDQRLYQATFTSPLEWTSFKEAPKIIQVIEHLLKHERTNEMSFDMLQFQHDVLEAINTLNAAITTKNVVPPFSAHAQIVGNGQVRSFDGTFFSFRPTDCSYLLVSDFLHNRFSLSVHYNNGQRSHLSFMDGSTLIEVDNSLKVTVQGRQMRLPQLIGKTFIQRYKNRLMLESGDGLKLECNGVNHICSVTVSGWYFGKTGGLFGIYDNEPSNDFMAPNRDILANPIDFVRSWQLSRNVKTCTVTPYTNVRRPSEMDLSLKCHHLFTSTQSALMPCFETVDPTKYEMFCAEDLDSGENVCRSTAAYIEYCKLKAIELWMPSECVSCTDDQNQDYVVGSSQTLEGDQLPRSADVVMLIENHECLKNMSLNSIPTYLDFALVKEGIERNRFGVVGFGGEDQHYRAPMPYTAIGEDIFTTSDKIEDAFNGIMTTKSSGTSSNMYEALQFSGRLPFRAGVIKMIIHISCYKGSTSNLVHSTNYGDALTMLKEQNIAFHRLQPHSFTYRNGKQGSEPILGLSADDLFTQSSLHQIRGYPGLRRQVQVPKHDVLTTLALESKGVVFNAQPLLFPENPGDDKLLSSLFAQRVSKVSEPASCQICDCIPGTDGEGYLQCRSCIQHEFDLLLLPSAKNGPHVSNRYD